MDCAQQILGGAALEQETAGAGAQCPDDVLVLVEGREDEYPRMEHPCDELAGRGDAVHGAARPPKRSLRCERSGHGPGHEAAPRRIENISLEPGVSAKSPV